MSRHLRTLKQGGLVEDGHPAFDARVRIYRLKDGATAELKQWLAETEALRSHQLASFKAHVEGGPLAGLRCSSRHASGRPPRRRSPPSPATSGHGGGAMRWSRLRDGATATCDSPPPGRVGGAAH